MPATGPLNQYSRLLLVFVVVLMPQSYLIFLHCDEAQFHITDCEKTKLRHPKKLLYVPGVISLLGLPLLLIVFGPEDPKYETRVRLFLPTEEMSEDTLQTKFTKATTYRILEGKKIYHR